MLVESSYSSCLNDSQWELIQAEFPAPKRRGRPPKYHTRHIVNAILYVARTGCQWRDLPKDFPHWNTCFQYFNKWSTEGLWLKIHTKLVEEIRAKAGKKKAPTAAIIDSQSVKTAAQKGIRGYDAGKKIKGRKRHMLVDTMGNILLLDVHSAAIQDRDGAAELLKQLNQCYGWLKLIWADGGYSGRLAAVLLELDRHRMECNKILD
jgi:transposase